MIILLFLTCKEDEPTAPEEEVSSEEVIAETTIGPEGGSLETEDFKLTIPAGAFAEMSNLQLLLEDEVDPFGEFSAAPLYQVNGLPTASQLQLQIQLKYTGTLSGESFIMIGKEDSVKLLDTSFVEVIYDLFEAQDIDGFLTSNIVVNGTNENNLNKGSNNSAKLKFSVTTKGFKKSSENFIFEGIMPRGGEAERDKIMQYFEDAYTRFKNAEFDYSNVKWPLKIVFTDLNKQATYGNTFCWGNKVVFSQLLVLSNKLQGNIHQTFIKRILDTYNNKSYIELESVGFWASLKFGSENLKIEEDIKYLMLTGNYNTVVNALLYDYLANNNEKLIAQICSKNKNLFMALNDLFGNPKEEPWLRQFYEHLMTNTKFEDISNLFFIENCHENVTINSDFDSKNLSSEYKTQSANWYSVDFEDDLDDEKAKLKFIASESSSGIIAVKFSPVDASIKRSVIKSGFREIIVPDIKQLAEEKSNLFILIINNEYEPIGGKNSINLKIEKNKELLIKSCSIFMRNLTGDFERIYPNGTKESLPNESFGAGFPRDDPTVQATFSNNTITQQYTNYQPNEDQSYSEKIVIVLADENNDGEYDYVSSFSADWEYTYKSSTTYKNSLSAITIPRDNSVPYLKFKLTGTDVCSKIQSLSSSDIFSNFTYSLIEGTQKCDSDSEIEIYISAE